MTERFDYHVTLPYERRRDKDLDGSTIITSTKPFGDGATEQIFFLSPKGAVREITILFTRPNGFERQYVFWRGVFWITAENRITNFGAIYYDKSGAPARIHPAPFYFAEYAFWKDAPTDEDRTVIKKELERYNALLHERYGEGNTPRKAFPDITQLCPKYHEYGERLRDLRGLSEFDPTEFVFKNEKWVVVEQVNSERSLQEFPVAEWDTPFLYDERMFTISRDENQLVFRQESIVGRKKKIVQVPLQIDYGNLQRVMGNPLDWEKVADVYPVNFYAEL